MMAPELIGLDRLRRVEAWLESALLSIVRYSFKTGKWMQKALERTERAVERLEELTIRRWFRTKRTRYSELLDTDWDIQENWKIKTQKKEGGSQQNSLCYRSESITPVSDFPQVSSPINLFGLRPRSSSLKT